MLLAFGQVLGLPGKPASALAPQEGLPDTSSCGSPDLDAYFNGKSGGAVESIVAACCEERPAPADCDLHRMSCINAAIASGDCTDPEDCEDGCHMFNSIAASCCPHVQARKNSTLASATSLAALPGQVPGELAGDEADADDGPPTYCGGIANDLYFDNLCGEGTVEFINTHCCKDDPPQGCDNKRKGCVKAQMTLGACQDPDNCDIGEQMYSQAVDSCCRSPPPPPRPDSLAPDPDAPSKLCRQFDATDMEKLRITRPPTDAV
jgi:hypothetical protein